MQRGTGKLTKFFFRIGFAIAYSISKKKTGEKGQCWNNAIESFTAFVVSIVISLFLKTVCLIKIGAVSSKFCLVSRGVIVFVVSLILFEKIEFS